MKHSNELWFYGISFSLCCFIVTARSQIYCPIPDVPTHGEYTPKLNKFFPGDRVNYTCKSGYIPVGNDSMVCRFDGYWSDRIPFCESPVKIKLPQTVQDPDVSRAIDDNINTCYTCSGCHLVFLFEKMFIVLTIRIYLNPGRAKIEIRTGVDNDMTVCSYYNRYIVASEWILIECRGRVLADTIRIIEKSDSYTPAITVCEIQVHVIEENTCMGPPDLRVANGYLEVNRKYATLICEDGYKRVNGRLVCDAYSWNTYGPRCEENLCDPDALDSVSTLAGAWIVLDDVRNILGSRRMQLECNTGYQVIGFPDIVTCQNNRTWTRTNATCFDTKSKTYARVIVTGIVVAVLVIVMLVLLGIIICSIRKQRKREDIVVAYKSTDGSIGT